MFFYSSLSVWDKRAQAPKGLIPHWLLVLRTPRICSSFDPAVHHPSLSSCSMQRGWSCLGCLVPLVPTPRGEGQATAVQCPTCSLPGMGPRAPRQSRGWTSICQELGRQRGSRSGIMSAPFSPPAPSDAASRHGDLPS